MSIFKPIFRQKALCLDCARAPGYSYFVKFGTNGEHKPMGQSMWWLALSTLSLAAGSALTWYLHRFRGLGIQVRPGAAAAGGGGPLISIIVPARNEARNIERCVTALLAQSYQNYEVIVVDD